VTYPTHQHQLQNSIQMETGIGKPNINVQWQLVEDHAQNTVTLILKSFQSRLIYTWYRSFYIINA
jgi:hypothetical protein